MNRSSYNAVAAQWDAARMSFFGREQEFVELIVKDLNPTCRILDLGCGTGRPIAEFVLSRGLEVTGVDQAENLLQLARERFPQGRWLCAQMESFEPDETYDGAIVWDSLFHIPREHHEKILTNAIRGLKHGSAIVLTVGGSDHPAFTDTMFEHRFFYDSHPPEVACAILQRLGASIERAEFLNEPTGGRDKGRYAIAARVT